MGYGVGQTTNQTGVGTSNSTSGQTQQAGYGGKGGGTSTVPQQTQQTQLAQPGQSSTAQSTPTPVFGGNAFGYNMGRLAQRIDPSATLPQAPQASTAPAQQSQQAATGGKGGGLGALPEVDAFINQLGAQPAQTTTQTAQTTDQPAQTTTQTAQTTAQQYPYGVSWNAPYSPYPGYYPPYYASDTSVPTAQPIQTTAQPAQQENPFASQMADYEKQMQDTQARYQTQLSDMQKQLDAFKDTGADVYELGPGYKELTNATTSGAEQTIADEAAANPPPPAPKIPSWYTNPDYSYSTYANYDPTMLSGMTKANVDAAFKGQKTAAVKDVTQAKADLKKAQATGNIEYIKAAQDNLNAQQAEVDALKTDQAATSKLFTGAGRTYESADTKAARDDTAAAKTITTAASKITPIKVPDTAKKTTVASVDSAFKGSITTANNRVKAAEKVLQNAKGPEAKAAAQTALDSSKAVVANLETARQTARDKVPAPTTTTKKKAGGGIIHNGMSNRLKHMLGEK